MRFPKLRSSINIACNAKLKSRITHAAAYKQNTLVKNHYEKAFLLQYSENKLPFLNDIFNMITSAVTACQLFHGCIMYKKIIKTKEIISSYYIKMQCGTIK